MFNGISLTIYQARQARVVFLFSSLIQNPSVNNKKKPSTILHYNKSKCGVDVLNSMCRKYTTRRPARRWPVHVLYNILDISAINAWVLYRESNNSNVSRRLILIQLIEGLCRCETSSCTNKTLKFCCGKCTASKRVFCGQCSP